MADCLLLLTSRIALRVRADGLIDNMLDLKEQCMPVPIVEHDMVRAVLDLRSCEKLMTTSESEEMIRVLSTVLDRQLCSYHDLVSALLEELGGGDVELMDLLFSTHCRQRFQCIKRGCCAEHESSRHDGSVEDWRASLEQLNRLIASRPSSESASVFGRDSIVTWSEMSECTSSASEMRSTITNTRRGVVIEALQEDVAAQGWLLCGMLQTIGNS